LPQFGRLCAKFRSPSMARALTPPKGQALLVERLGPSCQREDGREQAASSRAAWRIRFGGARSGKADPEPSVESWRRRLGRIGT
jgi:hypothetical protein